MPHTHKNNDIDLQQISTRNDQARDIVAGCASALPTLAAMWRPLEDALADTAELSALVTWLFVELEQTRLDRANLLAAMRATLAAHADGEPDPMWYLRDELHAPQSAPAASRRPR
jgi:hypothetical protein